MPECSSIDSLVTPYVDGELADGDRRTVDAHLRVCRPCRDRIAAELTVRDLVQARKPALESGRAPEALRARCAAMADAPGAPDLAPRTAPDTPHLAPRTVLRARLAPLALAASLVLLVGAAFLYQLTSRSTGVMAAELTADHLKCFALNGILGTHQSAPAVESSLDSGFGWAAQLPDTNRAGLELVGSRPCLYGKGRVAHVMYKHDGRPVSLFMLPGTERSSELVRVLGHEAAIWCVGNRTFVLIARESRSEVQQLASVVRATLR